MTAVLRDHPRACGEHYGRYSLPTASVGSSPRMRGTLIMTANTTRRCGIIPAHAGNTNTYDNFACACGDHPRACGEHVIIRSFPRVMGGSSPRMRGTRHRRRISKTWTGIIPAHAGNTSDLTCGVSNLRDHPRACGEHIKVVERRSRRGGSSPRMRGTHYRCNGHCVYAGIIPAHAGNT